MQLTFPTDVQEFDGDNRISFSRLDNKFLAVHDDGTEYEFDAELKKWILADEEPLGAEIRDYGIEQAPIQDGDNSVARKRSHGSTHGPEASEPTRPVRSNKKPKAPPQPKQNTAVYVTGLPVDATVSEVHDLFSRKGGVIAEEIDSGAPRIKLYSDENGKFKGDALVVFFKPQSVEMAIMLLDDIDFRVNANGTREGRMRVQAAESSYKKVQYDQDGGPSNGSDKGAAPPTEKRPQRNEKDRQKIIKKTQKLNAKLTDWDDDDPYAALAESNSKRDKTVILRHMFTLEELEEDPAALLEIKEDIREECSRLGAVTSVVLYDQEKDGIVAVRFQEVESALACIARMDGRAFDGRRVHASLTTGSEKFKKSSKEKDESDSE